MVIQPQTVFEVLKDVPLTSTYQHTILFDSLVDQDTYFKGKLKKRFTDFTYVRQNKSVRLPIVADTIYECNYCRFKNVGYGDKWFYGFITNVQYVNNDVTEVDFTVDYFQTWLTEMVVGNSYVEREHVADDTIGAHTVPENLPIGDYVIDGQTHHTCGSGVALYALEGNNYKVINNVFTPLTATANKVSEGSYGAVGDILQHLADTPEKIAMVVMVADKMINQGFLLQPFHDFFSVSRVPSFHFNDDTYFAKNNKLYTYPYCLFTIDNFGGGIEQYKWEDFDNPQQAGFAWNGSVVPKPSMEAIPIDYKGLFPNAQVVNTAQQFGVIYDNFPMCPYNIDTFKAWVSSTGAKQINSMAAGVATTAMLFMATQAVPGVNGLTPATVASENQVNATLMSAIGTALNGTNAMVDYQYAKVHGQSIGGSVSGSGLNWSEERIGFRSTKYTIRPEFARIIDDYFTRFGYKVNRYKVPELRSRESFNYVKTMGCYITGSIPNDAIVTISSAFDNGITLWHNTDVGNYSLQNNIVEEVENGEET